MLHIACWVLGEDPRSAFVVDIHKSNDISALKEEIKAKKPAFRELDVGDFKIWKVGMRPLQVVSLRSNCIRCLVRLLNWLGSEAQRRFLVHKSKWTLC